MRTQRKALTPAEIRIMKVLWARGSATVAQVVGDLPGRSLVYTTVLTILKILEEKGAVRRDTAAKAHTYRATLRREQAVRTAIGAVVKTFFENSQTALALQIISTDRPSDAELREIREALTRYEKEHDKNVD